MLEAGGRVGGRVRDDHSMGLCVGLGAMFVTGVCNNPFMLLSRQMGLLLKLINEDRCELINEQGHHSDRQLDVSVEKHFNLALDRLAEWREAEKEDLSLGGVCLGQVWHVP